MSDLSIIIPAYKNIFLFRALDSLAQQTDQDFKVYVGDDASPYDIKTVVEQFSTKLDIVYHRFEENLGGSSLIQQWERCIKLSKEDWIWLFSDDDVVSRDAVEVFKKSLNKKDLLYKFNTKIIDEYDQLFAPTKKFDFLNKIEESIFSHKYISNRLACNGFRSYAVEYVFHRSLFEKFGFVEFPLAWCSDDATWLLYSLNNKSRIRVLDSYVFWRYSGINISSDTKTSTVLVAKESAINNFVYWLKEVSIEYNFKIEDKLILNWLAFQYSDLRPLMPLADFYKVVKKFDLNCNKSVVFCVYIKVFLKKRLFNAFLTKR